MKPIIKIGNWWFFGKGVIAMSLFPFVFIDKLYAEKATDDNYDLTLSHEEIHIRQQVEMLVLLFYVWYVIEWFLKLFKYGKQSYAHISFEQEAYENDIKPDYLKTRKFWAFLKYL